MWVLTGPFDGELGAELTFQKSKLLKTGTPYPMGRKGRPLCIASKKVSHDHCEFVVGSYSVDDVSNPSSRPSLDIINKKDKGIRLVREDTEIIINPMSTRHLRDGDTIFVVTGVPVRVAWHAVCCFASKLSHSIEACALLGINLVHVPNPYVTHHLTPTYNASPLIACSLITSAQFVKPEWLHEIIRLGNVEKNMLNGNSLEESFVLPPTNKFRPTFAATLSQAHKVFNVWEPNEGRLHMFSEFRFICVGEKSRELDSDMRELIHRAGGTLDIFEVHGGASKFHKTLARGQAKEGKKLVLVANTTAMEATVGQAEWKELASKAMSFGLSFVNPDSVIQAVLDADVTGLDRINIPGGKPANNRTRSVSPDFVSNTLDDELSQPPPSQNTRKKLTRRVTSRQVSVEPATSQAIESEKLDVEAPKPRRALTRRVNAGRPMVTGLNDPSIILDAGPEIPNTRESPPPPKQYIDLTVPTPARSSRLKRRIVGVNGPGSLGAQEFPPTIDEVAEEPPLKKFKALFDESDPDRIIMESPLEPSQSLSGSLTQTQTQSGFQFGAPRTFATTSTNLSLLREEEGSQSLENTSTLQTRGTKRTLNSVEDDDMQRGEIGSTPLDANQQSQPVPKRRALEDVNATERTSVLERPSPTGRAASKPPQTAVLATGAPPGKPDRDAAFLKAIASTKRGKKSEDHFDREFNNLRISRPDLDCEEQEEEWNVLAEFGDDSGIRGNFMTVVEMDLFKERINRRNGQSHEFQWAGKLDFKKFKKNATERSYRRKIELVPTEGNNDEDMGNSYWKDGASQSRFQNGFSTGSQSQSRISPRKPSSILEDDSNDEEVTFRQAGREPPSRISSTTNKRGATRSAHINAPAKSNTPLFLDSDEDIKDNDIVADKNGSQTLGLSNNTNSSRTQQKSTRSGTKPNAKNIVLEDDSDDEAVFKGFATRSTRTRGR